MPSNVFKLLTAWVSVLSSQFSVLSSQFLSLAASGDCPLFGTRAARGGADIPAWLASSPKFAVPILLPPRFDSEQQEMRHSCNRFLRAWKSPSPAGIALPLLPAGLYGRMRVPAILWHDENRTFRLSRPRAQGRVRQQRNLPLPFHQSSVGKKGPVNRCAMKAPCHSPDEPARTSRLTTTARPVLHN